MMTRKEAIEFMRCNLYNTESCDKEECNQNKAITMAIEALEKLEQNCGNCKHHDELNFHNPNNCWCSKRHISTYADMHCTDWSGEDDK